MNPFLISLHNWEHRDALQTGNLEVVEYAIWDNIKVNFVAKKIGNVYLCAHTLGVDENGKQEITEEGISVNCNIFNYLESIPKLHYDCDYPMNKSNYITKARRYGMLELDFGFIYRQRSPEGDFDVVREITHGLFSGTHSHHIDFNLIMELKKLHDKQNGINNIR